MAQTFENRTFSQIWRQRGPREIPKILTGRIGAPLYRLARASIKRTMRSFRAPVSV